MNAPRPEKLFIVGTLILCGLALICAVIAAIIGFWAIRR